MNGRFSLIRGKDVTIEELGYYQTKPSSNKFFHTQTSTQRVSLLLVMAALVADEVCTVKTRLQKGVGKTYLG